jgi:hypothetical protein
MSVKVADNLKKEKNMDMSVKKRLVRAAIVVAALVATLGTVHAVLNNVAELWYATAVKDMWALSTPFFTRVVWPLVVVIAVIGGGVYFIARYQKPNPKLGAGLLVAGALLFVGLVIPGSPFISAANRSGYEAQTMYLENLDVTQESHPEYLVRQNYVQARTILSNTLNDSVVGGLTQLQYTNADQAPAWCAGVLSVKDGKGRQYVQGVRCLSNDGKVLKANFKGRVPSIGGAYSTNLAKQIAEAKPGMSIDEMDVRYAIVNGKAISVASVTRVEKDAYTPHRVPGGVFVFDENGKMTYKATVKPGEFNFAVVPYSIAEEIRGALNTRAGFWCMSHLTKVKCVQKNQPLEDTQHTGGEEVAGGVNAANYSEFVLIRKDGTIGMVTPLTMYGKGRNVVAYLDVDADSVSNGVMPHATLYNNVMEASNLMIAQTIAPAYTADITWIDEIAGDGETTSGSRIYEVTPTKPGEVFATIGTATNPQYDVVVRASIADDSLEFSWCVSDHQTKKEIECRTRTQGEAPIGTLRGLAQNQTNNPGQAGGTQIDSKFDTSKLSDQEKIALIAQLAEELKR